MPGVAKATSGERDEEAGGHDDQDADGADAVEPPPAYARTPNGWKGNNHRHTTCKNSIKQALRASIRVLSWRHRTQHTGR